MRACAALAAMCALVLTGCKTTATVHVVADPDGSGSVRVDVALDTDAARQVGDLSKMLSMADLKRAGWTLTGPTGRPGGAVNLRLTHGFSNTSEANTILAELGGPFRDLQLTRDSSLWKNRVAFTGTVDLSRGLDTFGDAELTRALGASLSQTVAKSGEKTPTGDQLTVGLAVDLSGSSSHAVTAGLGDAPKKIDAQASNTRWGIVAGGVAMIVVVAVVVVVAVRRRV